MSSNHKITGHIERGSIRNIKLVRLDMRACFHWKHPGASESQIGTPLHMCEGGAIWHRWRTSRDASFYMNFLHHDNSLPRSNED